MSVLDKYRDERDASGELTALAIAIDALIDAGCDCGHDEPPCLGCACEAALIGVVAERDAAHAKLAKVHQELAAAHWCDCGVCFSCRVADVAGVW